MARQTIEQWIHEALTDPDKQKPCSAIALVHRQGVRELELHTTKLGDRVWDPRALAKMLQSKAENYAAELPGVQTFNLLAFYGGDAQWEAIKPFNVNGAEEYPGMATELPTKDGFLQQAMRHTEAMTQMCLRQMAAMTGQISTMFEQVTRENMSLRKENQEAVLIVRDAIMKMSESREESEMKRLQFARASDERRQWLAFGPALINSLLGREVFPQNNADTALLEAITNSLTEDDMQKLAMSGIIKPHLLGPLTQRMSKILESKRLAAEAATDAISQVDPELDASGMAS